MKRFFLIISAAALLLHVACHKVATNNSGNNYTPTPIEAPDGAVDLGLSVYWAECNLGANAPEVAGDYYAWGETEVHYTYLDPLSWKGFAVDGYGWQSYSHCTYTSSGDVVINKYKWNTSGWGNVSWGAADYLAELQRQEQEGETMDDAARAFLGKRWRMPTADDFTELINNCTMTPKELHGEWGYQFTSKKPGFEGVSIFLPAGGCLTSSLQSASGNSISGLYWTASLNKDDPRQAIELVFTKNTAPKLFQNARYRGQSIRPVAQ